MRVSESPPPVRSGTFSLLSARSPSSEEAFPRDAQLSRISLHSNCYLDSAHLTLLPNLPHFCAQPFFILWFKSPPIVPPTPTAPSYLL